MLEMNLVRTMLGSETKQVFKEENKRLQHDCSFQHNLFT